MVPPEENNLPKKEPVAYRRVRNAVIMPDGTKREPMGSGTISGLLGVGGMANVYEIWNPQLEINRAVKLLHPNYTEETKQRFQTEIKITAKLHHPNIIEIHAVGQWNGLPYIEMERISGFTLEKIIADRGALPIEVCTSIGIMVGRALRYAHNQEYVIYGKTYHGVIHRDLKPSNIMVAANGTVKLMDFGIARPTDASIHTTDGSILGTMQYLSPEQLDGKEPDIRTDIYSLGTILYEMVTGVKAFAEQNVSKLMLSKIKNEFQSLDQYSIKIPLKFRKIVHRCMVHDREKRISNALAFLSEVDRVHRSLTPLSPEQVLRQFVGEGDVGRTEVGLRRRLPVMLIASGILGAAGIFCGITFGPGVISRFSEKKEVLSTPLPPVLATVTSPQVEEPPQKTPETAESSNDKVKKVIVKKAPGKAEKKESVPVQSFIDKLKSEHGTSDLMEILVREVGSRNYANALQVYTNLSSGEASSDKAKIFKIRALRGLGRKKELRQLLFLGDLRDGEFFLEKAKELLETGRISESLSALESCTQIPGTFMDNKTLRLERLYYTALCRSKQFNQNPSANLKNTALDSWFEVKSELQTSKDHRYFKEADVQMQRIAKKMDAIKG